MDREHAPTGWGHINATSSHSSASPSSSFSSSAASSMLAAAAPSNSSQSDISPSDHSAFAPKNSVHSVFPASRTSLATSMGQNYSRANPPSYVPPSPSSSKGAALGSAAAATGSRLKRVFAGRRKDIPLPPIPDSKAEGSGLSVLVKSDTAPSLPSTSSPRNPLAAKLHVFSKKQPKTPALSLVPPPTPPKPIGLQMSTNSTTNTKKLPSDPRGSIMPVSPSVADAVEFMAKIEEQRDQECIGAQQKEEMEKGKADPETIESKRKSDSTMTLRQGIRASRPVSMAESLQSTHTVVPANKRLSALITDAEFAMPEESDAMVNSHQGSPSSSIRSRKRRSMSLTISSTFYPINKAPTPPASSSATSSPQETKRIVDRVPVHTSLSQDAPTLSRAAANGIIAPLNAGDPSSGNNVRGRLAAWTAASTPFPPSPHRALPALPRPPASSNGGQPPSFRQTAISITNGFAPAAGLAKRAVEKMGRAWGGMNSSSSNSGHSSSSEAIASLHSNSSIASLEVSHTDSNQSAHGLSTSNLGHLGKGPPRRTPNAPSGAWSVISSVTSSSVSDSDPFSTPFGPSLGKCLRGPIRVAAATGAGVGGMVFGKDLRTCTRDTAVHVRRPLPDVSAGESGEQAARSYYDNSRSHTHDELKLKVLENRMLPAIVVRCAQHLLIWGMQEEGLFRVSGRPAHVAKLRAEFDTGSDYDMSDCNPGDLDPHAVSSVFKAYLRELPEPILTSALLPYFDAAIAAESSILNSEETPQFTRGGMRGPHSAARSDGPSMRKPPSLSTLAVPSSANMRPPSQSLLNAIRTLIGQLPRENRDLTRTVAELISATAKNNKETKMPLSNLLLVFCPSLNLNPPLLRVLCEGEGIWRDFPEEVLIPDVLDIKRASTVLDISVHHTMPVTTSGDEGEPAIRLIENPPTDAMDSEGLEDSALAVDDALVAGGRPGRESNVRSRPLGVWEPVQSIYLDSEEQPSSGSLELAIDAADCTSTSGRDSPGTASLDDDASYVSTSEGASLRPRDAGPPPLSSSAESLATPSTSSGDPSFSNLHMTNDPYSKPETTAQLLPPQIAESTSLPLPSTTRRARLSASIHFPDGGNNLSTRASRRMSIPYLSLPNFHTPSESDHSSPTRARRLKKPSLHILFSKSSASPLTSTPASSPFIEPASDSSISTPLSTITAPQSSTSSLPPVIDMPIEPYALEVGLSISDESKDRTADGDLETTFVTSGTVISQMLADLDGPSTPYSIGQTPIADVYATPSSSLHSLGTTLSTQPLRVNKPKVVGSKASLNHLGVLLREGGESEEDDWSRSVLLAAERHT